MKNVVYFVGAGLTKSMQQDGYPVPTMWDFTSTMAEYVCSNEVILTTMAELETAELYNHPSNAASKSAARLVGETPHRSLENKGAFREALRMRQPESIEVLLERALKNNNFGPELAPSRFIYGINQLFCEVSWNVNWHPLEKFIETQLAQPKTKHTFVSFNYDLILDKAIQRQASDWDATAGYGFDFPYYVDQDLPATENQNGTLDVVNAQAIPAHKPMGRVALLKPHGSLNWLVPLKVPYKLSQQGSTFADERPILAVTDKGEVRYWCSTRVRQYVLLPNALKPVDVQPFILPLSSAKISQLSFSKAIRKKESEALLSADEVIVIGWSCPSTDQDQESLIAEAVAKRNHPIRQLTVIDPCTDSAHFARLAKLFGVPQGSVRRSNAGFVEFALDHNDNQ